MTRTASPTTLMRMTRKALKARDAARLLGVTTREVYEMIERGELEPCAIDGKLGVWLNDS